MYIFIMHFYLLDMFASWPYTYIYIRMYMYMILKLWTYWCVLDMDFEPMTAIIDIDKNFYPSTSAHLDDLMRSYPGLRKHANDVWQRHQQHAVSWIKQVEVRWAWPLLSTKGLVRNLIIPGFVNPKLQLLSYEISMMGYPNMLYHVGWSQHVIPPLSYLKKPLNFVPLVDIHHHGGCQSGNGHHQCGRRENNRGEHCSKIPVGCWYNQWTPCRLICKKYTKNEI